MAWVEKTGKHTWRVRYETDDGIASIPGFSTKKAADDIEAQQRSGTWIDPAAGRTPLGNYVDQDWLDALDVAERTEENYRSKLKNHILPRWKDTPLALITNSKARTWAKTLRQNGLAPVTASDTMKLLSLILSDAADDKLIPTNPIRSRHRGKASRTREKVWATPREVLQITHQAAANYGHDAAILILTATWTGARWGELAGLQRDHLDLDRGLLTIDPDTGAMHESASRIWLGPPKTPASARTITLPPFLVSLLREYLEVAPGSFVFTSPLGCRLRRSTFDRRAFRPAVDGDDRHGLLAVRPGLTFHGLRHSHKTWLIADDIPEIAQAKRLGHHLANRLVEVYSHVAPEIETRLLRGLEQRWHQAHQPQAQHKRRPIDNRPHHRPTTAPHTAPAQRTTRRRIITKTRPQLTTTQRRVSARNQEANVLPNSSISVHRDERPGHRAAIIDRIRKALRPGDTPRSKGNDQLWT